METLGARVRRLREEAEQTQEQLVKQVPGMSASALSQLENDISKGVKPQNLLDLAKALGVSPHELVTGKPDPDAARPPKAPSTRVVRYTDPQEEKLIASFRKLEPERRAVIVALALLLSSCALVGGCATPNYTRAGATAEDVRVESAQCRERAMTATAGDYSLAGAASRESIQKACMEGKGWRSAS